MELNFRKIFSIRDDFMHEIFLVPFSNGGGHFSRPPFFSDFFPIFRFCYRGAHCSVYFFILQTVELWIRWGGNILYRLGAIWVTLLPAQFDKKRRNLKTPLPLLQQNSAFLTRKIPPFLCFEKIFSTWTLCSSTFHNVFLESATRTIFAWKSGKR